MVRLLSLLLGFPFSWQTRRPFGAGEFAFSQPVNLWPEIEP
jgi:hypothetical protein